MNTAATITTVASITSMEEVVITVISTMLVLMAIIKMAAAMIINRSRGVSKSFFDVSYME